ncbi:TlpA family protein disulfide reductase [Exilibacterium tricleocarpae]|uniref:TlpA family protein disulfide reductase n=1 Tax=Exilibacterium tricleocarpae TaxID=2591008 RepID=A0A545TFM2_9GAMM|nr:redoxin domain-containing protein [Exilibacterium tricleocarpae]TQV76020.1 TlpA family protein disulfide reductase [Exilibacterium tricleocarpae]
MAQLRFTGICLWLIFAVSVNVQAGKPLAVGSKAPDWILPDTKGKHVSFYESCNDHTAVVLFWATWCPYCSALMPELEALRRELKDEPIKFYALNIWEDGDPLAHMKTHDFGFKLVLNAERVAKRYGVMGTPGLFMIGPDKTIRYIRAKGSKPTEVVAAIRKTFTEIRTPVSAEP